MATNLADQPGASHPDSIDGLEQGRKREKKAPRGSNCKEHNAWFKLSVNGRVWCPSKSYCQKNWTYPDWQSLLNHVATSSAASAQESHRYLRQIMKNRACTCGKAEEDYEELFAHMEAYKHGEFAYATPISGPRPLLFVPQTYQTPNKTPASIPSLSRSLGATASSNGLYSLSTSASARFCPVSPSRDSTSQSYTAKPPPPAAPPLQHRCAENTRELPGPLAQRHVTRIIRPDGSTASIDWTEDEDVRIVVDDLINAGWVIIKSLAIPWKPGFTIDRDVVMDNQLPTAIRRVAIRNKIWAVIGCNAVSVGPDVEGLQNDAFISGNIQQLFGFRCAHLGGDENTDWSIEVRRTDNAVRQEYNPDRQ